MEIEIDTEQVPREFYRLVANLSDQLAESGVPQRYVDRTLDRVEKAIVEALSHAVEDDGDDEGSDDDDGPDED